MKYEGEFKDDKFDGYGVTSYTNGDKFEGELKICNMEKEL